jgi:TetR/AcrR family transcriptional repressor of nem operon
MSGAKKYKREEVLDRVIELFRRQGFAATSTAELVAELGINRKSMYAEFGSKQGLFEAALDRYSKTNLSRVLAPIEAPDADLTSIHKAIADYASAADGPYLGLGCLMANTAVERAALDPGSARYVDAYLVRLEGGFRRALENARVDGTLCEAVDPDAMAAFLAMSVVGISALIRAKAPPEMIHSASQTVTSMLEK